MVEPDPPARTSRASLGSVAEETTRLLDALLGAAATTEPAPGPSEPGNTEAGGGPAREGHAYQPASADGAADAPEAQRAPGPPVTCPTCGHVADGTRAGSTGGVCHLCPVCQLLRVVRSVRPETLDQLADLAAAVTDTLRDAATSRWHESGASPPRAAQPTVEDITVHGDEEEAR